MVEYIDKKNILYLISNMKKKYTDIESKEYQLLTQIYKRVKNKKADYKSVNKRL